MLLSIIVVTVFSFYLLFWLFCFLHVENNLNLLFKSKLIHFFKEISDPLELVIVVDTSAPTQLLNQIKDFVQNFITIFNLDQIQISLVSYSENIDILVSIKNSLSLRSFLMALQLLKSSSKAGNQNVRNLLKYDLFTKEKISKHLIMFLCSPGEKDHDAILASENLKRSGIVVSIISFGYQDTTYLANIATSKKHLIEINDESNNKLPEVFSEMSENVIFGRGKSFY